MDVINKRRSIRKFMDKPVEAEVIEKLLRAAMQAPSAKNQQPWEFLVIDNRAILNELAKYSFYANAILTAPVSIVVLSNINNLQHPEFWEQDMSAATENILLEAVDSGLGAVWLGVHPIKSRVEFIKKLFTLPDNIIPFSVVPIGYSDRENIFVDRYNQDKVHYNKW